MKTLLTMILTLSFPIQYSILWAASTSSLSGKVMIDGSSTVFPVSEAVAEDFQKANLDVRVSVAASGTGGGFKKFCKGETDISGASRSIEKSEMDLCAENKVAFIELPIGYDGIAVVVNPENTWAKSLTVAELKKIWEPNSLVKNWSDVRAGFPATKISIYGPGPEHGTFDYFTQAINGKEKLIRTNFNAANPDALVTAVKNDKTALAYFGLAYYSANKNKLALVAIDNGKGPVLPTDASVTDGKYQPLARPLFIYVAEKSLGRPEVQAFVKSFVSSLTKVLPQVGYAPFQASLYPKVLKRAEEKITGTLYSDPSRRELSMGSLLNEAQRTSQVRPARK